MPISPLPQAPYRQDRRLFPTPLTTDVLFSEIRDCNRNAFPEYGTPHPNAAKWPYHKLIFIKPVDIERDGIFEFFYAADRENQDLYNWEYSKTEIKGIKYDSVLRTYLIARDSFVEDFPPLDTLMPDIPVGKFSGNYTFFEKAQLRTTEKELDSIYILEKHIYVNLDNANVSTLTTADFGGLLATKTDTIVSEGSVSATGFNIIESSTIALGNGKSVQSVIRAESYPELSGTQIDARYGVVFDYTRQIVPAGSAEGGISQNGYEIISVEVEPRDQWRSLKTQTTLPSIPADQVWYGLRRESLPEVLDSITIVGTERFVPVPTWKRVPDGPLKARFTRKFSYGPPEDYDPDYLRVPYATETYQTVIEYDGTSVTVSSSTNGSVSVSSSNSSSIGTSSGQSTSSSSGNSVSSGSNSNTSTSSSTGTNSGTSTSSSTGTNTNTGTSTSTGTNTNTGTSTSTGTNTNTGTSTSTGTNTNTGTSTSTGTSTGTQNGTSTSTGTSTSNSSGSNNSSSTQKSTSSGESKDVTTSVDNGTPLQSSPYVARDTASGGYSDSASSGTSSSTGSNSGSESSSGSSSSSSSGSSSQSGSNSSSGSSSQSGSSSSSGSSSQSGSSSSSGSSSQSGSTNSSGTSTNSGSSNSRSESTQFGTSNSTGISSSSGSSESDNLTISNSSNNSTSSGVSNSTSNSENESVSKSTGKTLFTLTIPRCLHNTITFGFLGTSVTIPATTPPKLPVGWLEVSRQSEHWRYGIWVTETIDVYIPDF